MSPYTPTAVDSLIDLGRTLHQQGDYVGAREAFEQGVHLVPDSAPLLCELALICQESQDHESALTYYRQALEWDPDLVPALQNLGFLLANQGEAEQAIEVYERARQVHPTPMTQLLAALVLPVIYESAAAVSWWRNRVVRQLAALTASGLRVETSHSQIPTNFYLAYQGCNDRDIAEELGRIYVPCTVVPPANGRPLPLRHQGRLRVGFLSAFFHDHTIGRLNLGRVRHMDRDRFEVVVLSLTPADDAIARTFQLAADRFVPLPRRVDAARERIVEQQLDVLVFADVGMDSITTTLAFSRMAPVQCVTWGHPDTTGSPALDYFLSGEHLDLPEAGSHYTEQLVRLPHLGVYYECPTRQEPSRARSCFGLSETATCYVCPQSLFKLHPEFDSLLAEILAADPHGEIVLIEGRLPNWTQQLRLRFERTLPEQGRRVRFLPALGLDDYLSLLAVADVVLDPIHFGGGNSSYEAFSVGAPVVTLPGQYLRGRITAALYAKMGFTELIATAPEEYVELCLRVGRDRDYRTYVREQIRIRSAVLFADLGEVAGLESFLWSLTGPTSPSQVPCGQIA